MAKIPREEKLSNQTYDAGELVWFEGGNYVRVEQSGKISMSVNGKGTTLRPSEWVQLAWDAPEPEPHNKSFHLTPNLGVWQRLKAAWQVLATGQPGITRRK